jgi:WD40 repeat protein
MWAALAIWGAQGCGPSFPMCQSDQDCKGTGTCHNGTCVPLDGGSTDAPPLPAVASDTSSDTPTTEPRIPSLKECTTYQHNPATCDPESGLRNFMISGLAYSPDGRLLASAADDGQVAMWSVTSTGLVRDGRVLSGKNRAFLAFHPSSTFLAIGTDDGKLVVHDLDSGEIYATLPGHTKRIVQLAFISGGTRLLSLDANHNIMVWSMETKAQEGAPLTVPNGSGAMATDPQGTAASTWVAFGLDDGNVQLLDVLSASPLPQTFKAGSAAVVGLAFAPDGKALATGTEDGEVALWDMNDKSAATRLATIVSSSSVALNKILWNPWELAFTPNATHLLCASGEYLSGGTVRSYTLSSGSLADEKTTDIIPYRMSLAPDGSSLAVGYNTCGQISFCPAR